ncbi:MAG: ATP-binding domain-containing protein, partial [Hydrogenimonas sp.]|nr:ATP-binding domain-containing protein [Hydrogenimonas sp.]
EALYKAQEDNLRMIAVGDDDQCILESVNGADVKFFAKFLEYFKGENGIAQYALTQNYRCSPPIVSVASRLLESLVLRFKDVPVYSAKKGEFSPVRMHVCQAKHLGIAAVEVVREYEDCEGTTAYLAFSNNEVAQIYSHLHYYGIKAKYLIDRSGYRLRNLAEIFDFDRQLRTEAGDKPVFDGRDIRRAMHRIYQTYTGSTRLKLLEEVIEGFKKEYEIFYFSLWEEYLQDIQFEDFGEEAKIVVSTMHKSKGREFDRVVVTIPKHEHNDEWLRLLYVAFTRAKEELIIVSDDEALTKIISRKKFISLKTDRDLKIIQEKRIFPEAQRHTHIMSLRDVVLGYSYYSALSLPRPLAGEKCVLETGQESFHLRSKDNRRIERLSKAMTRALKERAQHGWHIEEIEIESVVFWYDRKHDLWLPHVLAKVVEKY